MSRIVPARFLIAKDESGVFRLTVRDVRYNSQSYPIVTSTMQEENFKTAAAARAFAKAEFGAEAGQFASK